jgi:DNA-binding Lrp family transcriptional regulator
MAHNNPLGLDCTDRLLLDALQGAFPLCERPFAELGLGTGIEEVETISRVRRLKDAGIIRWIGAIFDSAALGYSSALVAFEVPEDRIEAVAEIVSAHPGVSHNYQRDAGALGSGSSGFSLWFTLAVPPGSDLQRHAEALAREAGVVRFLLLPALRLFKIGVRFAMGDPGPSADPTSERDPSDQRDSNDRRHMDGPMAPNNCRAMDDKRGGSCGMEGLARGERVAQAFQPACTACSRGFAQARKPAPLIPQDPRQRGLREKSRFPSPGGEGRVRGLRQHGQQGLPSRDEAPRESVSDGLKPALRTGARDGQNPPPSALSSTSSNPQSTIRNPQLAGLRPAILALQEDLPITPLPFDVLGEIAGISAAQLLEKARELLVSGAMRRYAAILRHREAGFAVNVMSVWRVPAQIAEEVGRRMAEFPEVSHCYERPASADWPYSHYAMIHARTEEEAQCVVRAIETLTDVRDYVLLPTVREFKKTRVKYFTSDIEKWEKEKEL